MKKSLNILMISHHRRYRITTRQHPIAKHLVARGHQVTIILTANTRRTGITESYWDGFRVVEVPDLLWGRLRSGWDPLSVLRRIIYLTKEKEHYDFVHCFETRPATIYPALYYCRREHVPFFTDWIDWIAGDGLMTTNRPVWYRHLFGWIEAYYEEAFRAKAVGLTAISHALAQRAIQLGVKPENILHLTTGTSPDLFPMRSVQEARSRVGLDVNGPVIGFSSSDTYLDMEIVFAAMAILVKRIPEIKLLITGQMKSIVLKLARKHKVENNLILTGFLKYEELPWHLACADLFVLPFPDTVYNRGRWPNKICDYTSLGRPTVSNPTGDIIKLFKNHEIGLLARWEPVDFSEKILYLLENPEHAARSGQIARKVAVEELNNTILVARLEKFYYQILDRLLKKVASA